MDGIVMFYKQGVFLREFTDEELKLGVSSGSLTQNKSTLYNPANRPDNDINPVNPDYFIYFKNNSIPVSTSKHGAYLRFCTRAQIEKVLETNTNLTTATLIKDIAMQLDVYMPRPWVSGMLAWRIDKDGGSGNGSRVLNVAPWTVGNSFNFGEEWHTLTYKFTDFILATGEAEVMTLGAWLSKYGMTAKDVNKIATSLLTFVNGNCMYKNGQDPQSADPQWNCVPITDFEMGLANMRLVPLVPIEFE